jgi:lipopolysaccharide biosynthesis glycosyltransferase
VFEGALNQVKVHVIVQQKDVNDFTAALRCALPHKDWRVVPWEDQRVARLVSVRHGKKGYLAHALNYARFYLRDILGPGVEKALWLDSDTVVIGDITTMVRNALTSSNNAVAAVAREKKACGSHFLNCSNPDALELLWETRVDVDALDAFNAGVVVYDLKRWSQQKLTERVEKWLELNLRTEAFTLGTNPPLVLATGGRFERLSIEWNCQVGGGHGCARSLANGTVENGVLHWSGERKPWWAAGLSSAAGVRGAWSRALGLAGARCALRALPPDAAPNATVVLPANAGVPDFFAFRRGGPVFDGANVSSLMREHAAAFPSHISGSRAASSALRHRLQGRDPCGVLVVILRGRLYVALPTCDRQLTSMETGALQTLHRAVAGFDSIPPPLVVQFASPDSKPLAIEAIDRFAYHAAPAVACDAFQCAAKLARNALDALAEAAGPLQERDVLTACADCALRPVRFDDALRRVAQRAPGQARKGLKGYFAARAPVQISHREENVLDLRTPEPRARRRKRRRPVLPPPVG